MTSRIASPMPSKWLHHSRKSRPKVIARRFCMWFQRPFDQLEMVTLCFSARHFFSKIFDLYQPHFTTRRVKQLFRSQDFLPVTHHGHDGCGGGSRDCRLAGTVAPPNLGP